MIESVPWERGNSQLVYIHVTPFASTQENISPGRVLDPISSKLNRKGLLSSKKKSLNFSLPSQSVLYKVNLYKKAITRYIECCCAISMAQKYLKIQWPSSIGSIY